MSNMNTLDLFKILSNSNYVRTVFYKGSLVINIITDERIHELCIREGEIEFDGENIEVSREEYMDILTNIEYLSSKL